MLTHVSLNDYKATFGSKRRGGLPIHKYYGMCMHMLVSRWAARVTSNQLAILMFVLDRTLYHDKMSETVVFDQFLHGMQRNDRDEMVFCGLNISLPTLLKQLKELAEGGFLHVVACKDATGRTEIKPRLYAINCKKLFNLDIADEENPMILREPKQKQVAVEREFDTELVENTRVSALKTPRNARATPSRKPPQVFEGIYSNHTVTKVTNIGVASLADDCSGEEVLSIVAAQRQARLDIAHTRRNNRPTKPVNPLSKIAVQDAIDCTMARVHPTLPRVVVSEKPLGVLKKRIAEHKIDFDAFITWAIEYWTITASGHERASRRRAGEESKHVHKPIPVAPDFNTLSYRFPYFAACFRSHVHTAAAGLATTKEQELEQKVKKLERAVVAAKQDARGAQERERTIRRTIRTPVAPVEATPARVRRSAPVPTSINLDDDLPPAWDDHPVATQRRRK